MRKAPVVWNSIELGGTLNWLRAVQLANGTAALLVEDRRLRLISDEGKVLWSRGPSGQLCFQGDLHSDGDSYLLMSAGPSLSLLEMKTGKTIWQHCFDPDFVALRTQVADILPERPGLEAAIFLNHGEEGCLINFPPGDEPQFVWQKNVVQPSEFNERYDHHCHIRLDLSQPESPVIWNIRRYRCRGFDARSGKLLSSIEYEIGGAQRRNYGPFYLGRGAAGALHACVFGEQVQTHVHAIRLHRDGPNELAWQHYYGEVYKKTPGVAVVSHGVADFDGDGNEEMIYSVRDPAMDYRSLVRIRDVETGQIEFELPDHWGAGLFQGVGPDKAAGFLAWEAPGGATPSRGRLAIYRFDPKRAPHRLATLEHASLWGPLMVDLPAGRELLIRRYHKDSLRNSLERYQITDGQLTRAAHTGAAGLLAAPIRQVLPSVSGQVGLNHDASLARPDQAVSGGSVYIISSPHGRLQAYSWSGKELWHQDLQGGPAARLSAADLDQNGRAELVVATAAHRLQVFALDSQGGMHEQASYEYQVGWHEHHPAIYDLEGNGKMCLLANGSDSHGNFCVRAYRGDGSLLWETSLGVAADSVSGCVLTAGQFLAANHAGVAVSIADSRRIHEGTTMLDGLNGKSLWSKRLYRDGLVTMPYMARGTTTAYDFDHDGTEELGIDLLSYMAYLKGTNGDFTFVRPTHNIRAEGAVYAGHLYNTYCPIYKRATDREPHWFPTSGFGPFGMMKPDPRAGFWKIDLDYDVPLNVALVDVDGDGSLEAGYVARNSTTYVCRDVWSGEVEWELELPHAPNSPTITADVDGDGKGEYLCGNYCIGTNDEGQGVIRWQAPVSLGWPIIADFDGDGLGEIAAALSGKMVILKAQ